MTQTENITQITVTNENVTEIKHIVEMGVFYVGLSAYDVWLQAGNTGTAEQFLASLVGAPGTTDYTELENVPASFPPEAHTHEIADVNGLQEALDNAGGGGGGAWQVVGSPVVLDGSTQDITFSGLNLDADGRYKIIFYGYNPNAGSVALNWVANSDTTATNYRYVRLDVGSSPTSAVLSSNVLLPAISGTSPFDFELEISKLPGRNPIGWAKGNYGTVGTPNYRNFNIGYNSTANITSLKLDMSGNMAAGSKATLLKLVTP